MPQSILSRLARIRVFGKSPLGAYLVLNEWLWNHLPSSVTTLPLIYSYGGFLHTLVRLRTVRGQAFSTFFLRNRPELELIRRLADQKEKGSTLKIAVLGCSNGAEGYSILWTIRAARSDLNVIMHAVDISKEVLEVARRGVYWVMGSELVKEHIFERMTNEETEKMFDREGDRLEIKSWIKEGIIWHCGSAGDPEILNILGPQDIVVANNFLCHMDAPDAEGCLLNIARLVRTGGYLFASGIDLDVRTRVAHDQNWKPVNDLMQKIHDADPSLRASWPWQYWGLEPLNKKRRDWEIRYASAFQLGKKAD